MKKILITGSGFIAPLLRASKFRLASNWSRYGRS